MRHEGVFNCTVEVRTQRKELQLREVGVAGPLDGDHVAQKLGSAMDGLGACLASAAHLGQTVHGHYWIAFEIRPDGSVGRVEWMERPSATPSLSRCLFGVIRERRFDHAAARTIADLRLYLGGLSKL